MRTAFKMRIRLIYLVTMAAIGGCAAASNRVDIVISNSGFEIGNELYSSRSSLAVALAAKRITHVHFLPQKGVEYKQVEAAVGAAQDAGVDVGLVGNIRSE
jgi:hypothetical protein